MKGLTSKAVRPLLVMIVAAAAVLYVVFFPCSALSAGQNLLENPDFESGVSSPDGWAAFTSSAPGVTWEWDDTVYYSGNRSVSIASSASKFGVWRQVVPVTAGTVYELSGYLNVDNVQGTGGCKLELVFRDAGGGVVECADYPDHHGTIEWIHDFPYPMLSRAPEGAVSAQVNLYLKGPGKVWFDDIYFAPSPTGDISGTVTCAGQPVAAARVFIWATDYEDYTDESGAYTIRDVPVSAPRYLILSQRGGYRETAQGDIDVSAEGTTVVNLKMERGSDYPYPELRVKFASLRHFDDIPTPTVPEGARIDPGAYPAEVQPYLLPSEYIDFDHPLIRARADEIIASLNPSLRSDTRAVSTAVYRWIVENYESDTTDPIGGFIDTTSGGWQTVSGEGWCWGHNFTDWLYRPSEMCEENRGICIEHSRFVTALLRAAGIPARPVKGYGGQFWAQDLGGEGVWVGICTMTGRGAYRSSGNLTCGYECYAPSQLFNYALDEGPIIHSDWYTQSKCMWREVHPWQEHYGDTETGYQEAKADLEYFEVTGDDRAKRSAARGAAPGNKYTLHYSDFTLNLTTIGSQRRLTARFPLAIENDYVVDFPEDCAFWTNHPECVLAAWLEETSKPPVPETARWYNIEFDLTHLLTRGGACASGDYDGDGGSDLAVFRESSGLWAVAGASRCYFGAIGDLPVSGDYDGDGTSDFALFRESSGLWAIRGFTRFYFGGPDDRPVPGDYDGDGTDEAAVFQESSGLWAARALTRLYFGASGDSPEPGDYDGDGTINVGLYRAASGLWAIWRLSRFYFGRDTDLAASGDYDGDGTEEAGIFRPASGLWAVRGVSRSYFGDISGRPVPADYDGDAGSDRGIFYDVSGLWVVSGITRAYYGSSGDIPATR